MVDLIQNGCSGVQIINLSNELSYQLPKVGLGTADCMIKRSPKNTFSSTSYVSGLKLVPDVWIWVRDSKMKTAKILILMFH